MDSAAVSKSSFNRFPEELLIEIIEWILFQWDSVAFLKSLRLSCRKLAYLFSINAFLFKKIYLKASPEGVELLEKTDISRLRPFVKEIHFEPVKYSWATSLDLFKEIVNFQAAHYHAFHNEDYSSSEWKKYAWKNIERYAQKRHFSDEEIQQGYNFYISRANEVKTLFHSGDLENVWTTALRSLPEVESFQIGQWEFPTYENGLKEYPGCEVVQHSHDSEYHHEEFCWKVAGPVGDLLFLTALSSLNAAETKVRHLNISGVFAPDFSWATRQKWPGIKLDGLKSLDFNPACPPTNGNIWIPEGYQVRKQGSNVLSSLLMKCASTIEELYVQVEESSLVWPRDKETVALPKLKHLRIGDLHVPPHKLAALIRNATSLASLTMESTSLAPRCEYKDWKIVFDAIRTHKNRLRLKFDQIISNDAAEVSLSHHTSEGVEYEPSEDPWNDMDESLCNYVSNTGSWNKCLRMWFDDEESDEESNSDNNESDNDDNDEYGSEGTNHVETHDM